MPSLVSRVPTWTLPGLGHQSEHPSPSPAPSLCPALGEHVLLSKDVGQVPPKWRRKRLKVLVEDFTPSFRQLVSHLPGSLKVGTLAGAQGTKKPPSCCSSLGPRFPLKSEAFALS